MGIQLLTVPSPKRTRHHAVNALLPRQGGHGREIRQFLGCQSPQAHRAAAGRGPAPGDLTSEADLSALVGAATRPETKRRSPSRAGLAPMLLAAAVAICPSSSLAPPLRRQCFIIPFIHCHIQRRVGGGPWGRQPGRCSPGLAPVGAKCLHWSEASAGRRRRRRRATVTSATRRVPPSRAAIAQRLSLGKMA